MDTNFDVKKFKDLLQFISQHPKNNKDVIVNLTQADIVEVLKFTNTYNIDGVNSFASLFGVADEPIITQLQLELEH